MLGVFSPPSLAAHGGHKQAALMSSCSPVVLFCPAPTHTEVAVTHWKTRSKHTPRPFQFVFPVCPIQNRSFLVYHYPYCIPVPVKYPNMAEAAADAGVYLPLLLDACRREDGGLLIRFAVARSRHLSPRHLDQVSNTTLSDIQSTVLIYKLGTRSPQVSRQASSKRLLVFLHPPITRAEMVLTRGNRMAGRWRVDR